jgi:hypothetical protein
VAAPAPVAETKPARVVAHRDTHAADVGDWRELVAAGRYAEGVRAAERAGWSRVCRSANAVELLSLADAARLSGETSRAVEALLILRQRFPGTTSAATGAFSLGRLAFEKRGRTRKRRAGSRPIWTSSRAVPLMGDAVRPPDGGARPRRRPHGRPAGRRALPAAVPRGPYAGTARVILAD